MVVDGVVIEVKVGASDTLGYEVGGEKGTEIIPVELDKSEEGQWDEVEVVTEDFLRRDRWRGVRSSQT